MDRRLAKSGRFSIHRCLNKFAAVIFLRIYHANSDNLIKVSDSFTSSSHLEQGDEMAHGSDGLMRPDTTHSMQEPRRPPSPHTDERLNFIGLVLCSVHQFRLAVQVDPDATEDFSLFYRKYLDDVDVWQLDLRTRLQRSFALEAMAMEGLEDEVELDREGAVRRFRTALLPVPKERLVEMMAELLASSLPGRGYDARTRALLHHLKRRLNISLGLVESMELAVLDQLVRSTLHEAQDTSVQQSEERTNRKWLLTGIGAVAGGLAVGLTAGLAAPFVFPALASAVGLGSVAAFFASAGGIATMSILFGAAGAGLTGYRVTRRYGDVTDFSFVPINPHRTDSKRPERRLHVSIGISGWLESEADVWQPWSLAADRHPASEAYALQFERGALLGLGRAMAAFLTSTAASLAATELLKLTLVASAVTALMFPVAVLQSGDLIDNPWSVGMVRARLAGQILADVLRKRVHGHRPVNLYGYSLGALVILACLEELAREPEGAFGIIENVVLFGLPASTQPSVKWHRYRCLVAGRFIHCYSRSDWILRFLYRGTSLQFDDIAGLVPLKAVHSIESVDFSGLVKGHLDYREKLPELLELLNI